ncbi:CocE/NonD family hydrolase [Antrihabitans sp. NCIMB 15449]|uniref:CocE/NonD family hydrolase n=1 Tax=Antrihabitans spumae TaxID=3373370 RepID=A0ABW7JK77_9NOCA
MVTQRSRYRRRTHSRSCAVAGILAVLLSVFVPFQAGAEPTSAGYTWTEDYLTTPDGERIHVDVLRPAGLAPDVKTPVILTASPYRSHLMYLSVPLVHRGPSLENIPIELFMERGYTYVIADLRGYGGSTGCPDWGGPGERTDVKSAVEWAAVQPWSTGKVGMYGISYEGWTGLMGIAEQPKGLAAVAAFEPVPDPYAYIYMQGVSWNFTAKPVLDVPILPGELVIGTEHVAISQTPGRPDDTPEYRAAASSTPQSCYGTYVDNMRNNDPNTPYWQDRNLVDRLRGATTPLFLQQGFVDLNTRADRIFELWNGLGNADHRAWFGQIGHRTCLTDCRPTFAEEMLTFFDKHVAGKDVSVPGPKITVGQFDGRWRSETQWPPADAARVRAELRTGTYVDRGFVRAPDREIWSVTEPLTQPAQLSGTASMTAQASGPANASLAAVVYDVAPNGAATVITFGISLLGPDGRMNLRLVGQDWPIRAGHRIAVKLTDTVEDMWTRAPTGATVTVEQATIELPLLTRERRPDLEGGPTAGIEKRYREMTTTLEPQTIANAVIPLQLPNRTDN